jgi:Peptidase C13 family
MLMISESMSKLLAAGLFALLVFGSASTAPAAEPGRKVAVAAFGLFGDQSVFESEAKGAAGIVAKRFGADPVVVRANTKRRSDATVGTLAATLDSVAKKIDAENDILVLILTSHGSRGGLVVKAGAREEMLSPWLLAATLRYTGVRHRIVIISACYSGIFLPLADADTLVITAADADHPSFGCRDGAQWTYFGDAFFNTALRRVGNLRDAFNLARDLVRKRELKDGFDPSNPQMAGGENIEQFLQAAISNTLPAIAASRSGTTPEISAAPVSTRNCAPRCPGAGGLRPD